MERAPGTQIVNAMLRRLKHDPTYTLAPGIDARDLVAELWRRGTSLVRAQWSLRCIAGPRLRFAEQGVHITHRRHCRIGAGSVVEAYARLSCLSRDGFIVGERVTIGKFAILEATGVLWNLGVGLQIGDDSSVGDYGFLGCSGGIAIGRRVLMGQRVAMHSQNHVTTSVHVPIQQQGVTQKGIIVGDDCWLGSGSVILDGVELGHGCIVAAGSVVTTSFPPLSVVAGAPARVIRERVASSG